MGHASTPSRLGPFALGPKSYHEIARALKPPARPGFPGLQDPRLLSAGEASRPPPSPEKSWAPGWGTVPRRGRTLIAGVGLGRPPGANVCAGDQTQPGRGLPPAPRAFGRRRGVTGAPALGSGGLPAPHASPGPRVLWSGGSPYRPIFFYAQGSFGGGHGSAPRGRPWG